jgi:hypothetical protein
MTSKIRRFTQGAVLAVTFALPLAACATQAPEAPAATVSPAPSVAQEPPSKFPKLKTAAQPTVQGGPDGKISLDQLVAKPVDLPVTGYCASGKRQIFKTRAEAPQDDPVWVWQLVHTNLDADTAVETAVLVTCGVGQIEFARVVAFDRDAGGGIVSLGEILTDGNLLHPRKLSARPDGNGVIVDVSDLVACCETRPSDETHQTREYAWDSSKIAQVGGPLVFGDPAHVTDLQVTATDVVLGPVQDGKRTGTATLTVTNNGPNPSSRFEAHVGNCDFSCATGLPQVTWDGQRRHGSIAPGQSVSVTLTMSFEAATKGGTVTAFLLSLDMDAEKAITDLDYTNDEKTFKVTAS